MKNQADSLLSWRKSSYSGGTGGECVEVAGTPDRFLVRDSKNPDGPALSFGKESIRSLTDHIRNN